MTWFIFTLSVFSTYRIADVLAEDEGPFAIFRKMRGNVPAKTNAGRGIRCSFCVQIWVSAMVTWFLWWLGLVETDHTPLWVFGLSGAAATIKRLVD